MNVVYIATDSYISVLGISMISLLENTRDINGIKIYILSDDLSDTNKNVLEGIVCQYEASISFIDIYGYESYFDFDFTTSGFHSIVLARLLLCKYMPVTVKKVLYLDCDTVINGSLSELDNLMLGHIYAFAAVPELCMPVQQKKSIGLDKRDTYFNCGVLLINVEFWRQHELSRIFIEYYHQEQGKLMYNDQDILNHCCKGRILQLGHEYNFPPVLYYFPRYFIRKYQPAYYCKTKKEYRAILGNPKIIHYLGEERPWIHGNYSPYKKTYEYYKEISPWSSETLIYGKEKLLFCYHILNCITLVCPWFRSLFTRIIGIRYYQFVNKK